MTFSTTIAVAGADPVEAPHRERPVWPGAPADVVQKDELLTWCAAVDGGAVHEFQP